MEKLVIIPTYNEKENIANILAAVFGLQQDFHVLVIDDGSPDGTAQIVKELFAKYPGEVQSLRAPFDLVIQHIDYIVKLVGVDYVGIGTDFDGIESTPQKLDDITTYPLITKALLEKGYSKKDVRKILGGNFIRVLKANEKK